MSKRYEMLLKLKELLTEITEFNTIQVVNNLDDKYPYDLLTSELPAIKIVPTEEAIQYHAGHQAKNIINYDLYIYVINWDKEDLSIEENLLKLVRDKLGSDISIKETVGNTNINSIFKLEVDYPLIQYRLNISSVYVCSTKNV